MVDHLLAAGGQPPVSGSVSPKTAYRIGAVCETLSRLFNIQKDPPMTRWAAREMATSHWFDIGAAKRDLGYAPSVSTEEGLERLRAWLRNSKGDGYR
jgi:nucleoside-diphosphate-sugar epimerase